MSTQVKHPVFARFYSRLVVPAMARSGAERSAAGPSPGWPAPWSRSVPGTGSTSRSTPTRSGGSSRWSPSPISGSAPRSADERVELRDAVAGELPVGDGEADAVVFSLVLCTIDQGAALAEARRVLRPGGEIRFLEHVQAHEPGATRRLQRVLDATVWPRLFGGCHTGRDTAAAIDRGRLHRHRDRPLRLPRGLAWSEAATILGRAVRP